MTTRTVISRKRDARAPAGADFPVAEADVRAIARRTGEPAWASERRLEAWRAYQAIPMPGLTDEAWRRTDIRALPLGDLPLVPAREAPVDPALLRPLASEAHGALLVLRPGAPGERSDGAPLASQGVVFTDFAGALRDHADLLRQSLGSLVPHGEGKFAALAASTATDGAVVIVPPGVQLEAPLHSVLWAPGASALFASRMLVVVGEDAALTYVHESASPDEPGAAAHVGTVEILVGRGARLTFVELQNWGSHVWNFTHERARLERDAIFDWIFGAVGSRLTKNFSTLDLVGPGAQGRMSGFYFADGLQHLDHDTQQNHLAEHTTRDLLYKGALLGKSRSVWQGMIYVAPGAQKTDGYQANRNLVLSKGARADSIPGLEILADDVRCTHGATVGQLEEEPIFYLMSRGLPRREAQRLVVDGFFDPIMQRIPFEGVRERLKGMISEKMAKG
jgi:Fe-S cluster assembly protein SufD